MSGSAQNLGDFELAFDEFLHLTSTEREKRERNLRTTMVLDRCQTEGPSLEISGVQCGHRPPKPRAKLNGSPQQKFEQVFQPHLLLNAAKLKGRSELVPIPRAISAPYPLSLDSRWWVFEQCTFPTSPRFVLYATLNFSNIPLFPVLWTCRTARYSSAKYSPASQHHDRIYPRMSWSTLDRSHLPLRNDTSFRATARHIARDLCDGCQKKDGILGPTTVGYACQ
jgi:hypothetical protein